MKNTDRKAEADRILHEFGLLDRLEQLGKGNIFGYRTGERIYCFNEAGKVGEKDNSLGISVKDNINPNLIAKNKFIIVINKFYVII